MIQKHSALLEEFHGPLGGCVIYKAYYPQRGDDVAALIELACALPPSVRFVPVSPAVETLHDLRHTLPIMLDRLGIHPLPADRVAPDQVQPGWELEAQEILLQLICRVYKHYDNPQAARAILDRIEEPVLSLFLLMAHPQLMPGGKPCLSLPPISDQAPILIVGRPEVFAGYKEKESELRELLEDAGYPNRFEFVGTEPELLRSAYKMRDRKTRRIWTRHERYKDDVGFILRGQTSQGRTVIVAAGGYSLGTYAAVHTLLNPGPQLERAAGKVCGAPERVSVDVGIRCWLKEASDAGGFPLVHERRSLHISVVNPDDFTGYDWPRRGARELGQLMHVWDGTSSESRLASCGPKTGRLYMLWRWKGVESFSKETATEKLLRVSVHSQSYCVTDKQRLRPCGAMGEVLDQVCADLEKDRGIWLGKLAEWEEASAQTLATMTNVKGRSVLLAMQTDPSRETLSPILLIGPPGSGKEVIARIVARGWNGCGLSLKAVELVLDDMEKGRTPPTGGMDKIADLQDSQGKDWLDNARKKRDSLNTFDQICRRVIANEIPADLINSELFGIAKGAATGVRSSAGAFMLAGTGVLFLDELLELPAEGQTRFLSALQEAQIRPVGVGKTYVFLARVVAATNRGGNEFGLQRLANEQKVRGDLLGRFTRRYSVPPLCERPMETVTTLLETLRADLGQERKESTIFLRISRQAFATLITCRFPDNFRALKRLRNQLSAELVASFRHPYDPAAHGSIAAVSIRLEHLDTLTDIEHDAGKPGSAGPSMETPESESETEFYEFSLGRDLRAPVDPGQWWLSDKPPARRDKLREIAEILVRQRSALAELRQFAKSQFDKSPGPEALKQVFVAIRDQPVQKNYLQDFIRTVYDVMTEYDGSLTLQEARTVARLAAGKPTQPKAVFPLHGMVGRDDTERAQWSRVVSKTMMALLQELVPPHRTGEHGRPSYFHGDAVLALLSGD